MTGDSDRLDGTKGRILAVISELERLETIIANLKAELDDILGEVCLADTCADEGLLERATRAVEGKTDA